MVLIDLDLQEVQNTKNINDVLQVRMNEVNKSSNQKQTTRMIPQTTLSKATEHQKAEYQNKSNEANNKLLHSRNEKKKKQRNSKFLKAVC